MHDVIVVGSGPAGLTAAIYTVRSNLKTLVFSGSQPGGQLTITTDVEDFPGFPGGIQGPELMKRMREQAERLGVEFLDDEVVDVDLKRPFKVRTRSKEFQGRSVIIATGASARWLGIESETRLRGKGVSACAVCDGFFFKDKDVAVIGGGDAALREALFLAGICKSVTIIHRRDKLRAMEALQDRTRKTKNIRFVWDSVVEEFSGENVLESIKLKNLKTSKISDLKVQGAFVAIGHTPNTKFLEGKLNLEKGYIVVKDRVKTSVEGVFAAGDVHDYTYKQAVTAAGYGCQAALEARDYLEREKHK
jgi:thioredoxin reductase (NADPH)